MTASSMTNTARMQSWSKKQLRISLYAHSSPSRHGLHWLFVSAIKLPASLMSEEIDVRYKRRFSTHQPIKQDQPQNSVFIAHAAVRMNLIVTYALFFGCAILLRAPTVLTLSWLVLGRQSPFEKCGGSLAKAGKILLNPHCKLLWLQVAGS